MIFVVYGTTGELIKLAPVLVALRDRGEQVVTLCTGQQVEQIPALLDDLGLAQPDHWLARGNAGHDLDRAADLPPWAWSVLRSFVRLRRRLREMAVASSTPPLLIVHGDTFTTVIGALIGRFLRVDVAHIEAGMRSGDWRNPFPEELDRVIAARLARIHYAPGPHAVRNLGGRSVRGEVIDTGANTIIDALDLVPAVPPPIELPAEPFGLVSLHRFELLGDAAALRAIVEALHEAARRVPIVFVDHPVTAAAIADHGLDGLFDDRLRRIPRQRYFQFVALVKRSAFVVTDSGGSQQECARLGHPCLVHRAVTEHPDGLGGCVVLSRMDLGVVREFLAAPPAHGRPEASDGTGPTAVILEHMERRGFISGAGAGGWIGAGARQA